MGQKLRTGIVFVGTSNYTQFLSSWVQSVYTHLLVDTDRTLILFTDEEDRSTQVANEVCNLPVRSFHIDHQEWPLVTLNRYKNLLEARAVLEDIQVFIYLDADMQVVQNISVDTILSGKRYFSVCHPGLYMGSSGDVEQNPESCAYINGWDPMLTAYCQGCLWGGITPYIWNLIETCNSWTQTDWENKIIPRWHDESYLNRYMFEHREEKNLLPSTYAYPERWLLGMEPYIIHRHKSQFVFPRFPGGVVS